MRKIILLFLVSMFLIVSVSATYYPDSEIDLSHVVTLDGSPASEIACNVTVYDPNSNIIVDFEPMSNNFNYHNYTLNISQTSNYGRYPYCLYCTTTSNNATSCFYIDVGGSGRALDGFFPAIMFLILFGIAGVLFFLKFFVASGGLITVLGFVLLFSGFFTPLSVIVIAMGVICFFVGLK